MMFGIHSLDHSITNAQTSNQNSNLNNNATSNLPPRQIFFANTVQVNQSNNGRTFENVYNLSEQFKEAEQNPIELSERLETANKTNRILITQLNNLKESHQNVQEVNNVLIHQHNQRSALLDYYLNEVEDSKEQTEKLQADLEEEKAINVLMENKFKLVQAKLDAELEKAQNRKEKYDDLKQSRNELKNKNAQLKRKLKRLQRKKSIDSRTEETSRSKRARKTEPAAKGVSRNLNRWKPEEDKILLDQAGERNSLPTDELKIVATKTGRSLSACRNRLSSLRSKKVN